MIIPKAPAGISGTALAASLLREGWSVWLTAFFFRFLLKFIWSAAFVYVLVSQSDYFLLSLRKCMSNTKMQLMLCDMRDGAGDMLRLYLRGYYSAFFF